MKAMKSTQNALIWGKKTEELTALHVKTVRRAAGVAAAGIATLEGMWDESG